MSCSVERENVYTEYFKLIPYGIWSLDGFVTYAFCKDIYVDKTIAHQEFYGELHCIGNCVVLQEAKRARELLQQKKMERTFGFDHVQKKIYIQPWWSRDNPAKY
ncbi:hypothetical protein RhiirA1_399939 [Rhizophagus irregularis]|uniref:Uncharacterized protein n=2 Tax=Rhizophagus irregularis TaxID=588596 RepID=A0A2I1EFX4_9GLOM|nr:hypothetical protein GLOIN_2v1473983 [Rhizophagus irregularis DAOM 181602=DAOM 197198]PKC59455.1 hypothetical protein RhiirA1_399939 [Rhizophagus irregularis]PKY21011.1 hypothetical protein RhiirB3_385339 [Rhizophagus irregularis]POG77209.1 hypothetical protein GLOIN_2v1473983 [Rhizophagus irregularis DAOM 181602=DAOM 197198]|eukprot:XP_025184075.1 hypothetical protein GLOIN_2v1473983 [Rhizophagus irregularis DAOM 181602=DAOM 197198]